MKLFLFGRGDRLFQVVDSFSAKKRRIFAVTDDEALFARLAGKKVTRFLADPAKFDLVQVKAPIGVEDVVIVVESGEAGTQAILANLLAQRVEAPIVVYTPQAERRLVTAYPGVWFRNDKEVYREEVREVLRRMETRTRVARLRSLVGSARRTVVLIWGNPDPDAIASAFAFRALLHDACPEIVLTHMGRFTRPENKAMVDLLRIPLKLWEPSLGGPDVVNATVDAQPSFFRENGQVRFDIVIDHHPVTSGEGARYVDIRPEYGSTCTIFTEYFRECGVEIDRRLATGLFFGLKVDTANLTRNVNRADVEAFGYLRERVDENLLRSIELTQMPESLLDDLTIGLARRRTLRDVLVAHLGLVENPDAAVAMADFFIRISGISVAVVSARTGEKLVVILRSDGLHTHVGKLAEALFGTYGAAGGHRTMARAEIELARVSELQHADEARTEHWILAHLAQRLRGVRRAWRQP